MDADGFFSAELQDGRGNLSVGLVDHLATKVETLQFERGPESGPLNGALACETRQLRKVTLVHVRHPPS